MSEYFRVLKRIEKDQREGEAVPRLSAASSPQRPRPETQVLPGPTLKVLPPRLPSAQNTAFATLFNNLRARAGGEPLRCLVFAGVTTAEPVQSVIAGLAEHVEGVGLEVLRVEVTQDNGRALLRRHRHELSDGGSPVYLDLHSGDWQNGFIDWLRTSVGNPDLVLIEGGPLIESIDSALLARACDGLVIVAQTEITNREALHAAADRARGAGCSPLGLVMYGTNSYTPAWLNRFMTSLTQPRPKLED